MSTAVLDPSVATSYYIDAPKPGLYRDVAFDTYRRWAAANHSTLKHFQKSALHARYAMLNPEPQTEAQAIGHAIHVAILEPERFAKSFDVMPYLGKRQSSIVRAEEDKYRKERPEITFLDVADHKLCLALRDATWAHPAAKEILSSPGVNELSAVWNDRETGVVCKGRQDRFGSWGGWPTLVDLKSTEDASRGAFSRSIHKYGYDQQAACYLDGFDVLSPFEGDRRYVLLAVEKAPPYAIAVYELDQDSIAAGRRKYRAHLEEYARCLESGQWPGLGDGADLISLPSYALKDEEHY